MTVSVEIQLAEYFPLIARAVAVISSYEQRQTIYDRARSALVKQLRSVRQLNSEDIDYEIAALEEAIQRAEVEKFSSDYLISEYTARSVLGATPRENLERITSPIASLTQEGLLDAGHNPSLDLSNGSNEVATLPIRQLALLRTILSDLPGNAPRHLTYSLQSYIDEIQARGAQPIIGLLKDMISIIKASIGSADAQREWLTDGMQAAFVAFLANHEDMMGYYPADTLRESIFRQVPIDDEKATGAILSAPFQSVVEAANEAHRAGLTTEDFTRIVQTLSEFAKIISTLPNPSNTSENDESSSNVSAQKRVVLTGLGFLERAYNIAGSTATLLGPAQGNQLLEALHSAVQSFASLIRT